MPLPSQSSSRLHLWILALLLSFAPAAQAQQEPADTPAANTSAPAGLVDFFEHIEPLWKARCGECHIGDQAKEDFDVTDRDAMLALITPGDTENSELWTEYLTADPHAKNSLIMPPVAQGGRMPATELALIKLWIDEGATWPDSPPTTEPTPPATNQNEPLATRFWHFQGYFHPAVVHLPIGLILMAGLSLCLSWLSWKRGVDFARFCLLFGALFGFVAVAAGWSYADEKGYQSWDTSLANSRNLTLFWHRWLGLSIPIAGLLLSLIAWRGNASQNRWLNAAWKIGLLLLVGLVAWVGHQGGELTYGEQLFEHAFQRLLGTTP